MLRPTPHESLARATKVAALIAALDTLLPARDAGDAYRLVLAMGAEHWDGAAQVAQVNPPSAKSRALVVDHFRQAARVEAQRAEAAAYLASVCPGLEAA